MVQVPFNLTDPNLKIQTPHAPDFFACISHSGACTLTASSSMPPCAVSSTAHPPSIPPATSKSPLAALSQPQPAHSLLLSPLRPPAEPSTIATALSTIATALSTTEPTAVASAAVATAVATAVAAAVAAAAVASKPASISSTTVATAVSATAIAAFAFAFAALAALAITPLLPSSAGTLGRKPLLRAGRQPLSSSAALSAAVAAAATAVSLRLARRHPRRRRSRCCRAAARAASPARADSPLAPLALLHLEEYRVCKVASV